MRNELNELIERLRKAGLEELNTAEFNDFAAAIMLSGARRPIARVSFKISNGKIIIIYSEKTFEYSDNIIVFYNYHLIIRETFDDPCPTLKITDCWSCKPKDFDETLTKFINETH